MEHRFTYNYNASALGLGGVLKHGNDTTLIPSLASVALAPTGGEGFSEVLNYSKDGVSFSNARSHVAGYDSGYKTFTTTSDVFISNLNLFGRIKVALMQTFISSTREVLESGDIRKEADPDKARFVMRAMIRGLTVDDIEVLPEFDIELIECATYEQLTNKIGGKNAYLYGKRFGVEPDQLNAMIKDKTQPIRGSVISDIQHKKTDKIGPRKGFKLPVRGFGDVHLGELVAKPGRRRVNMLRLDLNSRLTFRDGVLETARSAKSARAMRDVLADPISGSPEEGSMTVLTVDGNGSPSWP